jgi:hypothetical protein
LLLAQRIDARLGFDGDFFALRVLFLDLFDVVELFENLFERILGRRLVFCKEKGINKRMFVELSIDDSLSSMRKSPDSPAAFPLLLPPAADEVVGAPL